MSGRNFAGYAPMDQRVIDLERQVAYLTKLVESLSRPRESRIIGGSVLELYVGKSSGAITVGTPGTVKRYEGSLPWSDSGTEDTVVTIIGDIADDVWVLYGRFSGIDELIAIQAPCPPPEEEEE